MVLKTLKTVLIKGYDNIGFLMLTNLLFVAGSLLIFTLPVTVLALSALTGELVKGKMPDFRTQIRLIRPYWIKGGGFVLVSLLITVVLIADGCFLLRIRHVYPWAAYPMMGAIFCLGLLWLLMQVYMLPLFLSGDLSIGRAFKKAFLLVIDNFGLSLSFSAVLFIFAGIMVLSGVGILVLMFSLTLLFQNQIVANITEKYHG